MLVVGGASLTANRISNKRGYRIEQAHARRCRQFDDAAVESARQEAKTGSVGIAGQREWVDEKLSVAVCSVEHFVGSEVESVCMLVECRVCCLLCCVRVCNSPTSAAGSTTLLYWDFSRTLFGQSCAVRCVCSRPYPMLLSCCCPAAACTFHTHYSLPTLNDSGGNQQRLPLEQRC